MATPLLNERADVRKDFWPSSSPIETALPRQAVDGGPAELLSAIRQITPEITHRAEEIEKARALPSDIFAKLQATGVFRMALARELGGAEYRLPDVIPIIEEIGRADGSTAWNVFIGTELASVWQHFDKEVLKDKFGPGHHVMTRAILAPRGTAERVDGGFKVSGRWPLGSGSYDTQWVLVSAVIVKDGKPVIGADGMPEFRIFALPSADAEILETWDSIGLRSTRSNDLQINGKTVPESHTIPFTKEERSGPLLSRLPLWLALGPFHCAMVLGVARGALDELLELTRLKRPLLNPRITMCDDPLTQHRIGGLETRLAAIRSFAVAETEIIWGLADGPDSLPPVARARFRSMMAYVHTECMAIANDIFTMAGSNTLYNSSSLQRRFRDMRAACQHIVASTEIYVSLGALVMGSDLSSMLLGL